MANEHKRYKREVDEKGRISISELEPDREYFAMPSHEEEDTIYIHTEESLDEIIERAKQEGRQFSRLFLARGANLGKPDKYHRIVLSKFFKNCTVEVEKEKKGIIKLKKKKQ